MMATSVMKELKYVTFCKQHKLVSKRGTAEVCGRASGHSSMRASMRNRPEETVGNYDKKNITLEKYLWKNSFVAKS